MYLSSISDNSRRTAYSNGERRNILRYNSICSYHSAIPNGHTSQDFGTTTNPTILSDSNRLNAGTLILYQIVTCYRMIIINDLNHRAYECVRTYTTTGFNRYNRITPHSDIVSYTQRRRRFGQQQYRIIIKYTMFSNSKKSTIRHTELNSFFYNTPLPHSPDISEKPIT